MTWEQNSDGAGDMLSVLSDEELVGMCRSGKTSAPYASELIVRYFPLIKSKAARLCYDRSVSEDIVQEGLLGLMNAIRGFDMKRDSKFSSFAYSCIVNRMVTASEKLKVQSSGSECGENEREGEVSDPESIFIGKELMSEIEKILSPSELEAFRLFAAGMTAGDISERLGVSYKSADNAVQRARKKLREHFDNKR